MMPHLVSALPVLAALTAVSGAAIAEDVLMVIELEVTPTVDQLCRFK